MFADRKDKMTLDEAKEFFFFYRGNSFFMAREEPKRKELFTKTVKFSWYKVNSWRREMLDGFYQTFITGTKEDAWMLIGHYVDAAVPLKSRIKKYVKQLLAMLEYAANELDPRQKLLIMETMAGRTETGHDGGIRYVKRHTVFRPKMRTALKTVLEKLADFDPADLPAEQETVIEWKSRYEAALGKMKRELR